MKKLLLAMSLALAAMGASAANYLHIKTDSGWEVLDLDRVDRLVFAGGVMNAQDASGNSVGSYSQVALEQLYVDDKAGVADVQAESKAKATFTFDAATMSARMLADAKFEIYGFDGSLLVAIPAKAGEEISLGAMRGAGVVIVKSGDYVIKVAF